MRQQTLATQTGFEKYGRKSKREQFLEEMEQIIPWAELQALIEPYYPKGENGRPPVGLSIMLRVYFLQQWFNLSDPGAEEALYESPVLRCFAGVDLGRAPAPDESTILQFRHLLEKHDLGGAMLQTVNEYLESRGIRISRGTIVGTSASRTSISHPEAHLWFRESEIPGIEKEPPAAVRLLRAGEPVSAQQAAGSGVGRSMSAVRVHCGLQQDRRELRGNLLAVPSSIPTIPKSARLLRDFLERRP